MSQAFSIAYFYNMCFKILHLKIQGGLQMII